jgi:hypothetical protein
MSARTLRTSSCGCRSAPSTMSSARRRGIVYIDEISRRSEDVSIARDGSGAKAFSRRC